MLVRILDIGNTPPNKESMRALYPGVAYFPPGTQMVLIKWSLLYMSASRDVWDEDNVKDLISVFITGPRRLFVGPEVYAMCLVRFFVPGHLFFNPSIGI